MWKKIIILSLISCNMVLAAELKKFSISEQLINIVEEKIVMEEGTEFNCEDNVEVLGEEVKLVCLYEGDFKSAGTHNVGVIGVNEEGDTTLKTIEVEILEKEEYNKYLKQKEAEEAKKRKQNSLSRSKETLENITTNCEISSDPVSTAQCFVGLEGWCTTIAQSFIDAFLGTGYSIFDTYDITYEEAKPGDVIYYADGGLGMQHYAVYLGNDIALQGNMSGGISKIGSIYLNYGTEPQFRRLNGR